jgi:2-methylisocitrate lyase-like PEP mutase family enzyme
VISQRFLDLHRPGQPLMLPNPWDVGSARVLASMGFEALATTSSGFAASLGRPDGSVTREEALAHSAQIVAATHLPVSADLENGFSDDPEGVAETVRGAIAAGLAGCSIEDYTGDDENPIYAPEAATERVRAAVEAAGDQIIVTARAENLLHGREDLADTIARLQSFQEAGAHVLYAPGLRRLEDVRTVVDSVDRPVNVLLLPSLGSRAELGQLGVARISVGGALTWVAYGALADAAQSLLDGQPDYWEQVGRGSAAARAAFD